MRSGSKKPGATRPPELAPWQAQALEIVGATSLAKVVTFGGGTALSVAYLHHRLSEDLDFFAQREVEQRDLSPVARGLARKGFLVDQSVVGPRRVLTLVRAGIEVGHMDFSHYPFDPVNRTSRWHGLRLDSLLDMSVNKLQAVLTRSRPRDYLDLLFLLREGPEPDLGRLLAFVRAKFGTGADTMALAERFLAAREVRELPRMLRPVSVAELREFFEAQARALVRR